MTKKALFLSGGWEGHEPQETSEFISSELQQFKIQSEIVNDLDVLGDIDFLKNFDIIIPVWTMGKIDDDNWEIKNSKIGNLQEVIHSGIGLAGWHGGMADAFRDNTNYIKSARTGLGIFEMGESATAQDREEWKPLIRWLGL